MIRNKTIRYSLEKVEDDSSIFLKTIIPSRQMNKKYNKGVSK